MRQRSDIPFNADDAHKFLPWVIGIMSAMATLLLFLGITLGGWILERNSSLTHSFTVNVPPLEESEQDKITDVRTALEKTKGVTHVVMLSQSQLKEMLEPWLGSGNEVAELPLPSVFDVTVNEDTTIDHNTIQSTLQTIVPNTQVDTQARWIETFASFSAAMQYLMALLALCIISGLALIVAFTSRAALKLHSRTVQLLHSIGAEDEYIARQFQYEAFLLTLRGTIPGCLAAGLVYWLAGIYLTSLEVASLPSFSMRIAHISLLLSMPLICGIIAYVSARIALIQQLRSRL